MRPRAGALAVSALLAAAIARPGVAPAQGLAFDAERYEARPGSVLALTMVLDPGDAAVCGLVATVQGAGGQAALFDWEGAQVTSLLDGSSFVVAGAPTPAGAAPGLRLVVYATGQPQPLLGADGAVAVARVLVPVRVGSRGEADVVLAVGEAADGQPLQAISLDGGAVKVAAESASARVVIDPAEAPAWVDFSLTGSFPGWHFVPRRPAVPPGQPVGIPVPGEGLRVRGVVPDSFGSWETDTAAYGPWLADAAGNLRVVDWMVGSNATGTATPPVRLRLDRLDGRSAQDIVVRDLEANGKDGVSIGPRSDGRRYRQLVAGAAGAAGREPAGWSAAFDLVQFAGEGTLGRGVWLSQMATATVAPMAVGTPVPIAQATLAGVGGGAWKTGPAAPGPDVPAVAYLRGPRGLGVRLPAEASAAAMGSWWMPVEESPAGADAASWFRLQVTSDIEPGSALRLRVASANQEWQASWLFEADGAMGPAPRVAWFTTPQGLDGQPLLVAFDVLPASSERVTPGARPAVYVADWELARVDAPVVASLP